MGSAPTAVITFTLNGLRHTLSAATVDSRLKDASPETVTKHAVKVNDTWYPVMQAFEVATGVPRREFISHTARRHLAALGYEVRGQIEPRRSSAQPGSDAAGVGDVPATSSSTTPVQEWHTEANVQAAVVTWLASSGWRIVSVANTAVRERGVDIVATKDGLTLGVEVKGFPSRSYADPARSSETKPTAPSTQAGHWYAHAVLAAMRLRGRNPDWRSVIALPDFPRYRTLHADTGTSLSAAGIEVWWVDARGAVSE